jgi:hypothetical protein
VKILAISKLSLPLVCLGLVLPLAAQKAIRKGDYVASVRQRPHELAGFLLHQDQKAFDAALGKPFHEEERENAHVRAYHVPGSKSNYLVAFFFASKDKDSVLNGKAVQLELTGPDSMDSGGFFGLRLVDTAEQAEKVLGEPSGIRHEKDENLDLWDYKESNYSLEFTADKKLYSIQISDQPVKDVPPLAGSQEARIFAQALQQHDWKQVMAIASGELECTIHNYAHRVQAGAASKQLTAPETGISKCLQKAAEAILALGPEMKGTEDALRIWEKGAPGSVTKFPKSCPLKEVVFVDEAGAFRVYEVTFR